MTGQPSKAWLCKQCKINAYWSHHSENKWTGGKGKWKCPDCSPAQAGSTHTRWSASGGSYSTPDQGQWGERSSARSEGGWSSSPGLSTTWTSLRTFSSSWGDETSAATPPPPRPSRPQTSFDNPPDDALIHQGPAVQLLACGLRAGANKAEIKKGYRAFLLAAHSDKVGAKTHFAALHPVWTKLLAAGA